MCGDSRRDPPVAEHFIQEAVNGSGGGWEMLDIQAPGQGRINILLTMHCGRYRYSVSLVRYGSRALSSEIIL